jgi:hypothetical protein
MATLFEEVYYRRAVFYCAFSVDKRIFTKKYFPFKVESICRLKRFTTESRNSLRDVRKSQIMPDQVQKWLRQQWKDFYVAGFDALVKRWGKCISVGGRYIEK